MKTKNKERIIRTGNRFGKTEMSMAAMETDLPKPRCSIPVNEINEIIDREVARVKASLTIYDDRIELIKQINDMKELKAHHETCVHNCRVSLTELNNELKETDLAIRREMDFNSI
jgi:hypothetical protein